MTKKVLFLMPNWKAASEVWMQRMMNYLGTNLAAVCAIDTGGETLWNKKVPAISLNTAKTEVLKRASLKIRYFGSSQAEVHCKILEEAIRQYEIDTVLVNYADFALRFQEVWRQLKIPVFVHFHGLDATLDYRTHQSPEVRYFAEEYADRVRTLAQSATFIVNSEFTKQLLIEDFKIDEDKIAVKYYGVPLAKHSVKHDRIDGVQILHLGRLMDFKSPDRTIAAFELACDLGLNGTLMVAGDGPLRITCELLRRRSTYKERIKLLGSVTAAHAEKLRSETDIYTQHNVTGELSKQRECLGVSIVEAMATGIPVVSTKSGAIVETVVHGETGILLAPGDVRGQAETFLKLAHNPQLRESMGRTGRQRVANCFSPELEAKRLQEILDL